MFLHRTAIANIYTLSLHDALPISEHDHLAMRHVDDAHHAEGDGKPDCREQRSEEHTSELQSHSDLVCRPLPEKKKPPLGCDTLYGARMLLPLSISVHLSSRYADIT